MCCCWSSPHFPPDIGSAVPRAAWPRTGDANVDVDRALV